MAAGFPKPGDMPPSSLLSESAIEAGCPSASQREKARRMFASGAVRQLRTVSGNGRYALESTVHAEKTANKWYVVNGSVGSDGTYGLDCTCSAG